MKTRNKIILLLALALTCMITSVSYTHLDVYKRQGIENDLEHHPGMVRAAAAFLIQLPET